MHEVQITPRPESLTDRERDILHLLDKGCSDREIARQLFLSPGTVKWYNRQIYGKLGVGTRTQALARARENGLLAGAVAPSPLQPGVSARSNLPAQLTPFIGRQVEVAAIRRLLATQRLLTLTGIGGTGKTRLALEVGLAALPDFPDGITFIPLAPVPEPSAVLASLGEILDIPEVALGPRVPRELRARVLVNASFLAYQQEDFRRSTVCAREGLVLAEEAGDRQTIAWAQLCLALGLVRPAMPTDDFGHPLALLNACLAYFREAGDRWGAARALKAIGVAAAIRGDLAGAKARFEEALAIFRALANPWGIAKSLLNLGELAQMEGDFALAERHYRESLHVAQALDDRCVVANTLTNLGQMLARRDPARAATCFAASAALYASVGREIQPSALPEYERQLAVVRSQLSAAAFDAAWEAGRTLACDQAIRFGLAVLDPADRLAAVS